MASDNSRLENKVDNICATVSRIDKEVSSVKSTLNEREKSEILRNEVIVKSMETHIKALESIDKRVAKLEENQGKVVWIVITLVITAVVGTIIVL